MTKLIQSGTEGCLKSSKIAAQWSAVSEEKYLILSLLHRSI